MTRYCNKRLEEWMEEILEPYVANNETSDPSEEMKRLLFLTKMEVAFLYDVTESEYEHIMKSQRLAFTELFGKGISNPLQHY